jgi:hypothetical protein
MSRSAEMVGMHTVRRPARRLLMPVMHVMHRMMVIARLRETDCGSSIDAGVTVSYPGSVKTIAGEDTVGDMNALE